MCCQALRISTMNFRLLNLKTRLQWQSCYWVEWVDIFFNLTEECRSVLFSQLFYSSNHLGHFQDILGANINRVFMVFCFGCFVTYLSVIRTIMHMEHQQIFLLRFNPDVLFWNGWGCLAFPKEHNGTCELCQQEIDSLATSLSLFLTLLVVHHHWPDEQRRKYCQEA